jgi:hypothetical protein
VTTTPDIPDLCKRLRRAGLKSSIEAADTLERQAAEIKRLREALWPFARYYDINDLNERDPNDVIEVPIYDLCAARAALTGEDT